MRVLMVLLAFVAMPYVAVVAQGKGKGHDPEHCARRLAKVAMKAEKDAAKGKVRKEKLVTKCSELPPPPPPPPPPLGCVSSAPSTGGTALINGYVYRDQDPWDDLGGWCVKLSGPVTVTAVTDAYGYYEFSGLPAGTYTVCEEVKGGWTETFPSSAWGTACSSGFGWTFDLADGAEATYVNFGNVTSTP